MINLENIIRVYHVKFDTSQSLFMGLLSDRQQQLLDWLHTRRLVSITEIQEHFSVSSATAYRDARVLIQAGFAIKASEGLKLPLPPGRLRQEGQCFYCGGMTNERTVFQIQFEDGSQGNACCSHCGLLAVDRPDVASALASDFLYGRMVNVRQAAFLVGSRVNLCCDPSVLCFANEVDAASFQSGFGGQVCSLEQAIVQLQALMRLKASGGG